MSSAFYNDDPIPSGRGWLIYPVRRLIRRLQRPYYLKLQSIIDDITARVDQSRQELNQSRQELNQLWQELQSGRLETSQQVRALALDHTAVIRRLAAIQDELITGFDHAKDAPPLASPLARSSGRSPQ